MKAVKLISKFVITGLILISVSGCVPTAKYKELQRENQTANRAREEAMEQKQNLELQLQLWQSKFNQIDNLRKVDQDRVITLKEAISQQDAIIKRLSEQIGESFLPPELNSALQEWAISTGSDLVTFDEKTGVVKFKSDLTFAPGSDTVSDNARAALEKFSQIMSEDTAGTFDIIVAGHTDDIPIKKPETRAKHPTNWHLSAHRAISVENILSTSGIAETRLSVAGFGEFRPAEPNAPGKKGNEKNRRVEIYIVPSGNVKVAK
ncbi:MAG: OmpA family protein [Phycisphaerae bacterium]|nr:OmpA family protein [Phycisphaerae bacterium]